LVAKLFRHGMSMQWARIVAAHLIAECKEYANGYCGGDTHIIAVPNSGRPVTTGLHEIEELESYLHGIDVAYEVILPSGSPMESYPDETLLGRFNDIKKAITEAACTVLYIETTKQQPLPAPTRKPDRQRSKGSK
jgi:hypothetical protein